jgi:hypothetical protein
MLFVQIGHNHGLYTIGSTAQDVPFDMGDTPHGDYWTQWGRLAQELAQLPADVGTILIVLLPKVGAVANLRPSAVERDAGYAPSYEAVLSGSTSILPGSRLSQIDGAIRNANARIRQIVQDAAAAVGTVARMKFLDTYSVFDADDYKNSLEPSRRIGVATGLTIDNRYLDGVFQLPPPIGPGGVRLTTGGFQSIDGMHPSGSGYAVLAIEAMNMLGLPNDRAALLQQSFAEDSLISHYPLELSVLTRLLATFRDLERLNHFVLHRQTFLNDQLHLTDALRMMKSAFNP